MKINKVTITGADDKVDLGELVKLSAEFPFVEWGILFSQTKQGTQRFASPNFVRNVGNIEGVKLSAHFCGGFAKDVLEKADYSWIVLLPSNFERVQLNYNFKHSAGYRMFPLYNFLMGRNEKAVIFQYNKSNKEVLDNFATEDLPPRAHFLYDSSGGNGKVIESISPSIGSQYTGYSGGITPDNIDDICRMITEDPEDVEVWIDLETGARTDNEFDLVKVRTILETANKYM